jgi:hypothetical protein
MDQHKLRSLVFDKTGVKLDVDDPVFALVALNEAVLEEAVERHIARLDAASQELAQQARLAGGLAARGNAALDASNEHGSDAAPQAAGPGYAPAPSSGPVRPIATQAPLLAPREWRLLAAAAGIALLSALVVLGGQAAFRKPDGGLSTEQALALQRAHKLEQAVQKLDPKVRAELQAELQK